MSGGPSAWGAPGYEDVRVLWLAGIPVADGAVLHLAATLREAELTFAAERLERAYER